MSNERIKVTIWNEFVHEKTKDEVKKLYPNGMHSAIAEGLGTKHEIKLASLDMPEHGLTEAVLNETDVLIWWGHMAHGKVDDAIVERVHSKIMNGMGLIVLHSGHFSKIFKKLMGTKCDLHWRVAEPAGEKERIWVIEPYHPICKGLPEYFELPNEEMYGERFDVPEPDKTLFISWFEGGEVCRSGLTYSRGMGKIFYFRPGHETFPTFYNKHVLHVIDNAIEWAYFDGTKDVMKNMHTKIPLEQIKTDK
jgi:trehalose utilization protein